MTSGERVAPERAAGPAPDDRGVLGDVLPSSGFDSRLSHLPHDPQPRRTFLVHLAVRRRYADALEALAADWKVRRAEVASQLVEEALDARGGDMTR